MKRCLLVLLTVFTLVIAFGANPVLAESDVEIAKEELLAADWIYFEFAAPGDVKIISYSTSIAVDLEIGTKDCCILDDIVEIYVNGCLVGTHNSETEGREEFNIVSLLPGDYVIELVNTVSKVSASGWYYQLTELDYSGAYRPDCPWIQLEGKLDAIEAKLDGLSIPDPGPALDAIEAKLDAVGGTLARLTEAITAIEAKLDAVETKLDTAATERGALEAKLDGAATDRAALESKLDAVEVKLGEAAPALQDAIDALEAKIDALTQKSLAPGQNK